MRFCRSSASLATALLIVIGVVSSAARAEAQSSVKPYFLVIVDTSGSMTGVTPGVGNNSCGVARTRMNDAKCVLQNMINSYGDAVFGLERFRQNSCSSPCNWNSTVCGGTAPDSDGEMLEIIAEDNQAGLLQWVDFTCVAGNCPAGGGVPTGNSELDPGGATPIAGAVNGARRYYRGLDPNAGFTVSPIATDPFRGCRPYYVILLTDGGETCSSVALGNTAITNLRTTSVTGGVPSITTVHDIKTFVIGFGIAVGDPNIEGYALNGGTDNPVDGVGGTRGFYATDEATLSSALNTIIASSVLTEVCDNADNDCDGMVDEGFIKYCDQDNVLGLGATSMTIRCMDPGDDCDDLDDNCYLGTTDEPHNACGTCGTVTEVCNGVDDDCNGFIDDPSPALCAGCVPDAEICDGNDNDCDGMVDEGLMRPCGNDVGACTPGTQTCTGAPGGVWSMCTGTGPMPESCDGLDNDCDGVVDGNVQACLTPGNPGIAPCQPGTQVCNAGVYGPCFGEIGPGSETCDGVDNDCDGSVDDGDPGSGAPCGSACGMGLTACVGGMLVCTGGGTGMPEVCNGFDDDCDGVIDNPPPGGFPGEGDPCDEMGTLCVPGALMCVAGGMQCVGGTPPGTEICDCNDNDCDGATDEGMLCGVGSSCLAGPYCQCAAPCQPGEFPCPAGKICVTPDPMDPSERFCVFDPCDGITCTPLPSGEQTECVGGSCIGVCAGSNCVAPFICNDQTGDCVEDNCNGFPAQCTDTEFCVDGVCEPNLCATVTCPNPDEFCRDGMCVDSCAGIACPMGQSCHDGACTSDPCGGVSCPSSLECDPATGMCVENACFGVTCPSGKICDPATGECLRDPCLGVVCPVGQTCEGGDCFDPGQLGPDAGPDPDNHFVTAAGEGCACATTGTLPGLGTILLVGLALAFVSRRRRAKEPR